ncbi:MAG: DsrE family protein [Actinobacteria bacterium]|nr:DsrE family protein [Actinomycetota bacterium]
MSVVETAYRATLEEQDDTVLWFTHAVHNSGSVEVDVLLRGNAVNYAVTGQDVSDLEIAGHTLAHAPDFVADLTVLAEKGVAVHYVTEDVDERGIPSDRIASGLKAVARADLPELFDRYDQIWHW